jgi:hypothetical protein
MYIVTSNKLIQPSSVRQGNTRLNKTDDSAVVTGTVLTPQAFVEIHWEWLAMLASQLFLTAVFLILTMMVTHTERIQVIKGSSLAPFCAMDWATRQHLGGINDLDALDQKSKELRVRLERGSSGVALWLCMQGAK